MTSSRSESSIERAACKKAAALGWLTFKWVSPGNAGVPDRILVKGERTVFVEFKTPTGRLSPVQKAQIRRLQHYGAEVYVVTSPEQLIECLENIKKTQPDI